MSGMGKSFFNNNDLMFIGFIRVDVYCLDRVCKDVVEKTVIGNLDSGRSKFKRVKGS